MSPTSRRKNVDSLLCHADLILDGTDNFETRYLINDYAVKNSIPWIYAAAVGSYAVTMNILPVRGLPGLRFSRVAARRH